MSGLLGFDLELLFGTQKESDLFRVLLACGGQTGQAVHLTHRRGVGVGGGVGVTLCNHIFYLFFSLNEMRVAAPCTPSTSAKRLTALKADTPLASALRWGSGLTRFLFVDTKMT